MLYPPADEFLAKHLPFIYEFQYLDNDEGLYPSQERIRRLMGPGKPYNKMVLYWPPGTGKSFASIAPIIDNNRSTGMIGTIVTKGDSGTRNFKHQVLEYKKYSNLKFDENKIFEYFHYMSLTNKIRYASEQELKEYTENRFYVFDEIHHVQEGFNLNTILTIMSKSKNGKFIFATATPMINSLYQLNSLRSLLGSLEGVVSYNPEIKNKPRVSFEGNYNAIESFPILVSEMIDHQAKFYRDKVKESKKKNDIYLSETHMCLFITPDGKYGSTVETTKDPNTKEVSSLPYQRYIPFKECKTSSSIYMETTKALTHIVNKDYKIDARYRQYLKGDKLRRCGAKYFTLMKIIEDENHTAPILIFLSQVNGSGVYLLCNILEEHGYSLYRGEQISRLEKKKRYTYCVGDESQSHNFDKIDGFNSKENKYGEYIRILIGSNVIGESITLFNVKQFHAMTPHWNESSIKQAIGRVVRNNSHSDLPENEREVRIYLHAASIEDIKDRCVDIKKLKISMRKQREISHAEEMLRKISIDRYMSCDIDPQNMRYDSFILYQMDNYFDRFLEQIQKFVTFPCSLNEIIKRLNLDPSIVLEMLSRIVMNNIEIDSGRYLREDFNGIFFKTAIPELSFISLNSIDKYLEETPDTLTPPSPAFPLINLSSEMTRFDLFDTLQNINFAQTVSLVETLIENKNRSLYRFFDPLILERRDSIYHIIHYRLKDSAYTASYPIPKMKDLSQKTKTLRVKGDRVPFPIERDLYKELNEYVKIDIFFFVLYSHDEDFIYFVYTIDRCDDFEISRTNKEKDFIYRSATNHGSSFIIYRSFDSFNYLETGNFEGSDFVSFFEEFRDMTWKYISNIDLEKKVIEDLIEKNKDIQMMNADKKFFLIFSLNDRNFRIRRNEDNKEISDRRKIMRGRTLNSLKKEDLLKIYYCLRDEYECWRKDYDSSIKTKHIIDSILSMMIHQNHVLIY